MKKSRLYIIIGLVLLILFTVILVRNKKRNKENIAISSQELNEVAVRVAKVEYGESDTEYLTNGTFAPSQELNISSEMGGRILNVYVDEGSEVKAGQTLAIIKGDAIEVNLSSARANYQSALDDYNRYSNAFKLGGVTQQQLNHAQLNLKNAKSALDQANIRVNDTSLRTTINGIVDRKFIEVGSVVGPGSPVFHIVNVSKLKLQVQVNEKNVINLKLKDIVKIKASAYPNKEFIGEVSFISPKADGALNFRVELEILNDEDRSLKAGMYGTAVLDNVSEQTKKQHLVIPRKAFINGVSNQEVFVVEDNAVILVSVTIGNVFNDFVEVIEGLREGEIVVISGHINLNDGKKVRIVD